MSSSRHQLEVTDRNHQSWSVELEDRPMVIGRSSEAHIRIDHDTVSKRHAEVFRDPYGRWWIRDLGSRNGVRFDGSKVAERVLHEGDRLRLGDFYVRLIEPPADELPAVDAAEPGAIGKKRSSGASKRGPGSAHAAPQVTLVDDAPASISTLSDGQSPQLSAQQLAHVIELGRKLLETADAQQRRQFLCATLLAEAFRSTGTMVLRVARGRDSATPPLVLAHTAPPGARGSPHISRSVLTRAVQVMQPILASNAPIGPVDAQITIARGRDEMAAVACPLWHDENACELLYVLLPPACGTTEWLALISLCAGQFQQAAAVWAERSRAVTDALIDDELKKAKLIQSRLVPKVSGLTCFDMGIGYRPCRWVGGDYLDVIETGAGDGKGTCLIAIADVCGKGLQAALVAGTMHSIVHTAAAAPQPPALPVLMEHLNRYLMANFGGISYATCVLLRLNGVDGSIECVNAGHLPPIIVTGDGQPRRLPIGDHLPLGLDQQQWNVQTERLNDDEWLGLTTDGVTELFRPDGSILRLDGWESCLRDSAQKLQPADGATELAAKIMTTLDVQCENATAQDDRTFLVARRRAGE